jgi:hypothetical protein
MPGAIWINRGIHVVILDQPALGPARMRVEFARKNTIKPGGSQRSDAIGESPAVEFAVIIESIRTFRNGKICFNRDGFVSRF